MNYCGGDVKGNRSGQPWWRERPSVPHSALGKTGERPVCPQVFLGRFDLACLPAKS